MNAVLAGRIANRDVPGAARAVLCRHGRTFHFASHLLGATHGERAATLYAFCRHVDNLADEAGDVQAARLALAGVRDALVTGRAEDAWTAAMLRLQASTGLPLAPALELVAGVASDLDAVRIADEDALVRYAYRVAGTVGQMMCAVLDVHDPRALPFAVDLGIAMQMTNIARDVGEDARMGRRYLPASWIGDVAPADIAAPDAPLQHTEGSDPPPAGAGRPPLRQRRVGAGLPARARAPGHPDRGAHVSGDRRAHCRQRLPQLGPARRGGSRRQGRPCRRGAVGLRLLAAAAPPRCGARCGPADRPGAHGRSAWLRRPTWW